jgi:hypothetical protein
LTSKREIYPTIGNDKNQGKFRTVLFNMTGAIPTTATPPRSPNSQEEKDAAETEIDEKTKDDQVSMLRNFFLRHVCRGQSS